jgi:hypothetical protein
MKLEYHDNTPTVILGQWFQEHTAYDVLTGETVRSLVVYYRHSTEEKNLNGAYKPTRKTTVEGIRIETSTSRSLIFTATGADLASLEERQVHFWQPHAAEEHGVHDPVRATVFVISDVFRSQGGYANCANVPRPRLPGS